MIKTGAFREDLYYRLNVLIVDLPPLRERREDIIPLIHHFTEKICRDLPGDAPVFSDDALENMRAHHWAGNVRELENFVHRLLLMNKTGVIDVSAFPENMRFTLPAANSPMLTLEKVENLHILRVLKYVEGNKTHAAEILGISRKTLREKLKRFS
jgi:DNA-binding NtrC family response regulator